VTERHETFISYIKPNFKVIQDYSMAEIGAGIIMATLENFTTTRTRQIMVKEIVVIFYK